MILRLTHKETKYLYHNFLSKEIRECIDTFISSEVELKDIYDSHKIWEMDQKIGGIGGYAMSPNPTINPFPSGIERSLYRPLQYATADIDCCDIRMHARYIVSNCGLHLETICKLILKQNTTLGKIRYNNITLGKSVHSIQKLNIIKREIIDALFQFVKLYNLSKHEVNQDECQERLFNSADALVVYFSARIVGLYLLRKIHFKDSDWIFELKLYNRNTKR